MRHLIVLLLLTASAAALSAETVYECVDPNGNLLFTNMNFEAKGCKALNLSPGVRASGGDQQQDAAVAKASLPEVATWLDTAREDSEARRQTLEDWARGPRDTLDPVTHALVDPDESVRTRAQKLLETAISR